MQQVFITKEKGFVKANQPPAILKLYPTPVTHAVLTDTFISELEGLILSLT